MLAPCFFWSTSLSTGASQDYLETSQLLCCQMKNNTTVVQWGSIQYVYTYSCLSLYLYVFIYVCINQVFVRRSQSIDGVARCDCSITKIQYLQESFFWIILSLIGFFWSGAMQDGLKTSLVSPDVIALLTTREETAEMLKMKEYIDLIIPRGSNDFVQVCLLCTYAYVYTRINMEVHTHRCMHGIQVHTYTCVHRYTRTHVHVYASQDEGVLSCVHAYKDVGIQIHVYASNDEGVLPRIHYIHIYV